LLLLLIRHPFRPFASVGIAPYTCIAFKTNPNPIIFFIGIASDLSQACKTNRFFFTHDSPHDYMSCAGALHGECESYLQGKACQEN